MMRYTLLISALGLASQQLTAQASQPNAAATSLISAIDAKRDSYADVAKRIWEFAEVGYQETRSSALLQEQLSSACFSVSAGVAEIPTAFVATYGSGKPVIGIIGEFDALPGLSQAAVPERKPLDPNGAGHACGHHLFGTGSVAAAIAVKDWMKANNIRGTLKVFGTPAEEGGAGKVFMLRAGLFSDVDIAVAWHPGDDNSASMSSTLANVSAKFRFRGVSAHAAGAPERGRSALDGVEAMNLMVNLMREHVPDETRIHYVITNGGRAPNVVPDFAEVYYVARHGDMRVREGILGRILTSVRGAALGTDTKMDFELVGAVYNVLPNEYLGAIMQRQLQRVGGVTYTASEQAFAEALRRTLPEGDMLPIASAASVREPSREIVSASTDMGDVSWNVPTVQLGAATWVPGTPAHSWQAVAAGGMSIGAKGMIVAAKAMALTTAELFTNPAHIEKARAEFRQRVGDHKYRSRLEGQKPALDYRR
jgi:aminobenzoyl-glutamate utilization protein B